MSGDDPLVVVRAGDAMPPRRHPQVVIGLVDDVVPSELAAAADVLLAPHGAGPPDRRSVAVIDPDVELERLDAAVRATPLAAGAMVSLLRQTELLPVPLGLAAESAVYSTLLAGAEFALWLDRRGRRSVPETRPDEVVLLDRAEDVLTITLNRPERRNAYGAAMRDGLVDALDLVLFDESITRVVVRGAGPSFCSGGDLDEFGTARDVAVAHHLRLDRSAAARLHACRDRVTALLHGACVGAGIELPAFAGRVEAAPDTVIRLPELSMGLVPGAGGTVSITSRIGRHRTAWWALSGAELDAPTALAWGLVDGVTDP